MVKRRKTAFNSSSKVQYYSISIRFIPYNHRHLSRFQVPVPYDAVSVKPIRKEGGLAALCVASRMPASRKRKSHLIELARLRRARAADGAKSGVDAAERDPDFVLESDASEARASDVEVEWDVEHDVGRERERQEAASRQRRGRARLRGLGRQAHAMQLWLLGANSGHAERLAAAELVERAVATVLGDIEKAMAELMRATAAAAARERRKRAREDEGPGPAPRKATRARSSGICSQHSMPTAIDDKDAKRLVKRDIKTGTKRLLMKSLTPQMVENIARISRQRKLKKSDVFQSELLSRTEWAYVQREYAEIRKIIALNQVIYLRQQGVASREAYTQAANSVVKPLGKPVTPSCLNTHKLPRLADRRAHATFAYLNQVNWQTVRRWLVRYVRHEGKVLLERRGRHTSTQSFLSDTNKKEQALVYLRQQMALTRAKNSGVPPLTIATFHKWCNSELLAPELAADPRRKPIAFHTARAWLLKLGFRFQAHTKSIYFDGHERPDVVRDRMEKLVTLKVLTEVTVSFIGRDCEEVRWPVLHPGEPPLVLVSQDECAFHSNDDKRCEWAELGKGLSLRQKSRGSLLMVSAFISELKGFLKCSEDERMAYIQSHPNSAMAAKIAKEPNWSGSSTLILEPGAAPGKDKYFDAQQLLEQTQLAMEIFEATHRAPARWAYHYVCGANQSSSSASYPGAFEAVWLPEVNCKAIFFFDHSTGHGAWGKDALVASHLNKGPDWKHSVQAAMKDGWFKLPDGRRQVQAMQFKEGDTLPCEVVCPPGIDADASGSHGHEAVGSRSVVAPTVPLAEVPPPTTQEDESAFRLYMGGRKITLKRHNPGKSSAELVALGHQEWTQLPSERRMLFVSRVRASASASATANGGQASSRRIFQAGSLVPQRLWGRQKGLECILTERGLYPVAGLKATCNSEKEHSASNNCCCVRLLSVQADFAAEKSALQHLIEERKSWDGVLALRHLCLFLPKFHCELNWIERLWGAAKQYTRAHCLYTLPGLRETVPIALSQDIGDLPEHLQASPELPVAPLFKQRRWARVSRQYMIEYGKGQDANKAIQMVKSMRTSKRHRDTNDSRSRQVEAQMAARALGLNNI